MPDYTSAAERPVLVAASAAEDKRVIMEALHELALPGVLVSDGAEAMQSLCRRPNTFAAVIVGDRVDAVRPGAGRGLSAPDPVADGRRGPAGGRAGRGAGGVGAGTAGLCPAGGSRDERVAAAPGLRRGSVKRFRA